MTAEEIKEALRNRHPALGQFGGPGPWTVLEEWANIDLLAFSAWSSAKPPIVGYEVKVSRGDFRRELLNPSKRERAVTACYAFYLATPKGLLTKEEKAYIQPEHFEDGSAFVREKCPARCHRWQRSYLLERRLSTQELSRRRKTGREVPVDIAWGDEVCIVRAYGDEEKGTVHRPDPTQRWRFGTAVFRWEICDACGGLGYLQKSVVEQEAPTLWIPPDVGLVEVSEDGRSRVVRKAPIEPPTRDLGPIGQLVRWASYRPDPRHADDAASLEVAA